MALRRNRAPQLPVDPAGPQDPAQGRAGYLARALSRAAEHGHQLAAELLGHPAPLGQRGGEQIAALTAGASEPRSQVLALATVLAGIEAGTGVHSWRNLTAASTRYLEFLASTGYQLADVERRAMGQDVPDDDLSADGDHEDPEDPT